MTRLIGLVRHGAHDDLGSILSGRTSDVALSDHGRHEAEMLGRAVRGRGIAAVVSSPRRRTAETAAILAGVLGMEVETDALLDEIDFGSWSGRRFADLAGDPGWDRWNACRGSAPTPGGETMAAAVVRGLAALGRIAAEGGGPALCVSHCDVIRGMIAGLLGLPLDNLLRFEIGTGSVSWVMVHGQGQGHVLTVNGRE